MIDAPDMARRSRIGKPGGGDRFCPPNQSARRRLAQPDDTGKAYLQAMSTLGWEADVASVRILGTNVRMNPEIYRVRIDGRRVVIAVAGENTVRRISTNLGALGASQVGPGAWICDVEIPTIELASAVGELADGEVVYLTINGDFSFLTAPKNDGGIIVTSR